MWIKGTSNAENGTSTEGAILKRVAIAGAGGLLGSHIFDALVASGRYEITVLTRAPNSFNTSNLEMSVNVVHVDYHSLDSLRNALEGQDVLISVLGKAALQFQPKLIDAAVAAHVKRIIPSEFGSDLRNPKSRQFPTYRSKIEIEEQLERHYADHGTTYTLIYNNVLLEWGLTQGFLVTPQDRSIKKYDCGDLVFSTTRMVTVALAVVGVLNNFSKTSNRAVYVHDIAITQNEIIRMVQDIVGAEEWKKWRVVSESTAKMKEAAHADLEKGALTPKVFYGFAVTAALVEGYGGHFQAVDNELLGVPAMDKVEVKNLVSRIVTTVV